MCINQIPTSNKADGTHCSKKGPFLHDFQMMELQSALANDYQWQEKTYRHYGCLLQPCGDLSKMLSANSGGWGRVVNHTRPFLYWNKLFAERSSYQQWGLYHHSPPYTALSQIIFCGCHLSAHNLMLSLIALWMSSADESSSILVWAMLTFL